MRTWQLTSVSVSDVCSDVIFALLLLVCLEADALAATDLELVLRLGDVRSTPGPVRLPSIPVQPSAAPRTAQLPNEPPRPNTQRLKDEKCN